MEGAGRGRTEPSDARGDPPAHELVVGLRGTREETKQEFPVGLPAEHFGEHWWGLIVAHHQVIARMRIDRHSSVPKVPVYNPGLVLLMVVDPQVDGGTPHIVMVPLNGLVRNQDSPQPGKSTIAAMRNSRVSRQAAPPSSAVDW